MPSLFLSLILFLLLSIASSLIPTFTLFASSYPLSTIAISEVGNQTVICALLPTSSDGSYGLNCTGFPSGRRKSYRTPAGYLYSAVAAGKGFLCAVSSEPSDFSTSSMRWWDFTHPDVPSKRVYNGPSLTALAAGDSHVCGLIGPSSELNCWRWPELSVPPGLRLAAISVGGDFVCGLVGSSGTALCFGGNTSGVVGTEPQGVFSSIAAGTRHACVVSVNGGELACWGEGAPPGTASGVGSLALGNGRTCVVRLNGTLHCLGSGAAPPPGFETAQFMSVEARGSAFCGVLVENYSVVCWGSEAFQRKAVVFDQVLPGSCGPISGCRCGVLPGSGNTCSHGEGICQPCFKEAAPPSQTRNSSPKRRLLFILLGAVGLGVACTSSACFLALRYGSPSGRVYDSGRISPGGAGDQSSSGIWRILGKGHGPMIREYGMETLLAVTEEFAERNKVGSGGFGSVYRAALPDRGIVAIKRGRSATVPSSSLRRQEMEAAFVAELALLSRVNHKNLVRLYGFCREGAELILVYEFVARGTLDAHLTRSPLPPGSPLASWPGRIKIALDAARGIEYLHAYAVPTIIHRDIKSSNILLDEEWTAKVSDFGLSLLNPKEGDNAEDEERGAMAAGTVGYMDPEYYRLRHLTAKSDVYSFGVVLLELLTGSKAVERSAESGTPRNVVEHAVPSIEVDEVHRVLDERLPLPTPCEIEAVAFLGYLAADCVSPSGRDRPTMTEVVAGLERALLACAGPGVSTARAVGPGITAAPDTLFSSLFYS